MDLPSRFLLANGTVVLLVGLLAGVPYGRAITRGRPDDVVRAWRVAHGSLCMGATTMVAVAAALTQLAAGGPVKWATSAAFVVCGYGFALALPTGAAVGHRGLTPAGPAANRLVYAGNIVGVVGSLVGTAGLMAAAAGSFWDG